MNMEQSTWGGSAEEAGRSTDRAGCVVPGCRSGDPAQNTERRCGIGRAGDIAVPHDAEAIPGFSTQSMGGR